MFAVERRSDENVLKLIEDLKKVIRSLSWERTADPLSKDVLREANDCMEQFDRWISSDRLRYFTSTHNSTRETDLFPDLEACFSPVHGFMTTFVDYVKVFILVDEILRRRALRIPVEKSETSWCSKFRDELAKGVLECLSLKTACECIGKDGKKDSCRTKWKIKLVAAMISEGDKINAESDKPEEGGSESRKSVNGGLPTMSRLLSGSEVGACKFCHVCRTRFYTNYAPNDAYLNVQSKGGDRSRSSNDSNGGMCIDSGKCQKKLLNALENIRLVQNCSEGEKGRMLDLHVTNKFADDWKSVLNCRLMQYSAYDGQECHTFPYMVQQAFSPLTRHHNRIKDIVKPVIISLIPYVTSYLNDPNFDWLDLDPLKKVAKDGIRWEIRHQIYMHMREIIDWIMVSYAVAGLRHESSMFENFYDVVRNSAMFFVVTRDGAEGRKVRSQILYIDDLCRKISDLRKTYRFTEYGNVGNRLRRYAPKSEKSASQCRQMMPIYVTQKIRRVGMLRTLLRRAEGLHLAKKGILERWQYEIPIILSICGLASYEILQPYDSKDYGLADAGTASNDIDDSQRERFMHLERMKFSLIEGLLTAREILSGQDERPGELFEKWAGVNDEKLSHYSGRSKDTSLPKRGTPRLTTSGAAIINELFRIRNEGMKEMKSTDVRWSSLHKKISSEVSELDDLTMKDMKSTDVTWSSLDRKKRMRRKTPSGASELDHLAMRILFGRVVGYLNILNVKDILIELSQISLWGRLLSAGESETNNKKGWSVTTLLGLREMRYLLNDRRVLDGRIEAGTPARPNQKSYFKSLYTTMSTRFKLFYLFNPILPKEEQLEEPMTEAIRESYKKGATEFLQIVGTLANVVHFKKSGTNDGNDPHVRTVKKWIRVALSNAIHDEDGRPREDKSEPSLCSLMARMVGSTALVKFHCNNFYVNVAKAMKCEESGLVKKYKVLFQQCVGEQVPDTIDRDINFFEIFELLCYRVISSLVSDMSMNQIAKLKPGKKGGTVGPNMTSIQRMGNTLHFRRVIHAAINRNKRLMGLSISDSRDADPEVKTLSHGGRLEPHGDELVRTLSTGVEYGKDDGFACLSKAVIGLDPKDFEGSGWKKYKYFAHGLMYALSSHTTKEKGEDYAVIVEEFVAKLQYEIYQEQYDERTTTLKECVDKSKNCATKFADLSSAFRSESDKYIKTLDECMKYRNREKSMKLRNYMKSSRAYIVESEKYREMFKKKCDDEKINVVKSQLNGVLKDYDKILKEHMENADNHMKKVTVVHHIISCLISVCRSHKPPSVDIWSPHLGRMAVRMLSIGKKNANSSG